MRKVNYRVVLDVLTTEDDDANGVEAIKELFFWPDDRISEDGDLVDVQDVTVKSVEVSH